MRKIILIILAASITLSASPEDDRRRLILETNGITENEIKICESKNALCLYDIFILALKKNENIAIEGEKSFQSLAQRDQAFGAFLPRIYVRGIKVFPDDGKSQQKTGITLYARQNLFTGLSEYARYRSSGFEIKLRKSLLLYNSGQLLLESSRGLYSVLQLETAIKNREGVLKSYRGIVSELRRRVAVGKIRGSDVLLAEGQIQRIEADILSLKNELHRGRLRLQTLSGMPHDAVLMETPDLHEPSYSLESALNSINSRPEIKAAEYEVSIASQSLLEAKGGHLPTAYLEGSYSLYSREKSARDYNAYMGIELPIFSGGITSARVKESESRLRQAELRLSAIRRSSIEELTDAYTSWKSSSLETEAYREAARMAERNYNMVLREYRLSLTGIIDVFTSLKELQSANDDFERKRLQHILNRIRLGVASGEYEGEKSSILGKVKTG